MGNDLWDLPMPDDSLAPGTSDRLNPDATGPYGSLDYVARDVYDRLRNTPKEKPE